MLFQAEITSQTVLDKELLTQQLYIFLNDYVPTRLIYESKQNQEDCIQDTIMFMLQRFDTLYNELKTTAPNEVNTFNYEKWFFNRAKSFVSYWLRRIVKERKQLREYVDTAIYFQQNTPDTFEPTLIDYTTLENIAASYNLNKNDTTYLMQQMETLLHGIGYDTIDKYKDLKVCEKIKHITLVAQVAVDEYIVESGTQRIER